VYQCFGGTAASIFRVMYLYTKIWGLCSRKTLILEFTLLNYFLPSKCGFVAPGGIVVSVLATGPKVRGFDPDRGRWIFKGNKKIRSTTSFGGEVKPSVPCRRFTACKRTLGHE
jgi:hypothetical protein